MKKFVVYLLMPFISWLSVYAQDEYRQVRLNVETAREQSVVVNGFCEFLFKIAEEKDNGEYVISMSLKNISPYTVVLFHESGDENDLKKSPLRIKFDNSFTGKKGTRTVHRFPNLSRDRIINTKICDSLFSFSTGAAGDSVLCATMPIYLAQYLTGGKGLSMALMDMRSVEISVALEEFTDERIPLLEKEYEELVAGLDSVRFCPDEDHQPPLESQKRPYRSMVDSFRAKLDSLIRTCGYSPKRLLPYKELAEKAAGIDIDDESRLVNCGGHYRHSCEYCTLSLHQIYMRMDDIYMQIISSENRIAVKNRYWPAVSSMYQCVREAERTGTDRGGFRGKIEKYYKTIKNIR